MCSGGGKSWRKKSLCRVGKAKENGQAWVEGGGDELRKPEKKTRVEGVLPKNDRRLRGGRKIFRGGRRTRTRSPFFFEKSPLHERRGRLSGPRAILVRVRIGQEKISRGGGALPFYEGEGIHFNRKLGGGTTIPPRTGKKSRRPGPTGNGTIWGEKHAIVGKKGHPEFARRIWKGKKNAALFLQGKEANTRGGGGKKGKRERGTVRVLSIRADRPRRGGGKKKERAAFSERLKGGGGVGPFPFTNGGKAGVKGCGWGKTGGKREGGTTSFGPRKGEWPAPSHNLTARRRGGGGRKHILIGQPYVKIHPKRGDKKHTRCR